MTKEEKIARIREIMHECHALARETGTAWFAFHEYDDSNFSASICAKPMQIASILASQAANDKDFVKIYKMALALYEANK